MDKIINSDPTLKFFIVDADIDWFNDHQLNIRINAIKIALGKFIDKMH